MAHVELKNDERLELEALRCVGDACRRFEADWRSGHSRHIGAYVNGVESRHVSRLIRGLMASEVAIRQESGEFPSREEYLARYPE